VKIEVDRKRKCVVINAKENERMSFEAFFKAVSKASLKIAQSHAA
jgi:hypothetical protein